jgi:hypothetical protein
VRLVTLALLLSLVSSCSCDDEQARNEAMLFLDRFQDIDVDDELEERRTAIAGIHDLALTDATVIAARDTCVTAHEALIEAEDQHAVANHLFVESSAAGEHEVPAEVAAQINAAIEHSDEAIARSRELFPRCTSAVSQLERRYHRRHST